MSDPYQKCEFCEAYLAKHLRGENGNFWYYCKNSRVITKSHKTKERALKEWDKLCKPRVVKK